MKKITVLFLNLVHLRELESRAMNRTMKSATLRFAPGKLRRIG